MKVLNEVKNVGLSVAVVQDRYSRNEKTDILISRTEAFILEADLAMRLIERWGIVAGELDGEDSAGRQKLRRLTADELVAEACNTAKLAYKAFRERGWSLPVPTMQDAEAMAAEVLASHPETS